MSEFPNKGIEVCKSNEGLFIASIKFIDSYGYYTICTMTSEHSGSEREAIEKLVKFLYSEASYIHLDHMQKIRL